MEKKLFQFCPRCERAAARKPPRLTPREHQTQLKLLAFLCHDPLHIDLNGKARYPGNLPMVTFQAGFSEQHRAKKK
jgi:hypothetical protein